MNTGNTGESISGTGVAAAGGKVRVYELAKELGVQNKDLVSKIRELGIEAKNHMSSLEGDDVSRIKRAFDKARQENLVETRINATVIRRRTKDGTAVTTPRPAVVAPPTVAEVEAPPVVKTKRRAIVEETPVEEPAVEAPVVEEAPVTKRGRRATAEPEVIIEAREERHEPAPVEEPKAEPARSNEVAVDDRKPRTIERSEVRRGEAARHSTPSSVEAAPIIVETKRYDGPPQPVAQVGAQADVSGEPAAPKKPEPVKMGPTGRVIELPQMRQQPVIEITNRPAIGVRTPPDTRRGDTRRGDRFDRPGKKKAQIGKKQKSTQITTPAAHKRVIKMDVTIGVGEIGHQMGIKATDVLKKLWGMGMTGITMNSSIDQDAAALVASEFGYEIENVAFQEADVFDAGEDAPEDLVPRAPVVTIMGHVDHGKTSLLDAIRNANVAGGEAGGITQHIGAYKVTSAAGDDIVFLDTPGHEAFTAMRARGAQATDIVVLVVAADDGVMPTTLEALNHAKEAEVTVIVAVNKIDKANAQPERIRQQLADHGLIPEAWGGTTIFVDISARQKIGIDKLLEMLALQAEVLELKANPNKLAKGVVIEGKLDRNRGPVATILVQDGTLKVGDTVTAGEQIGKVRAMLDDKGRNLTVAGPSTPVEVLGLSGVPGAGESFNAVADEKAAKELVEHRRDARRRKELAGTGKVSLENILDKIKHGEAKELKIVLKTDVQGSAEALKDALTGLATDAVGVHVINSGVGGITESDVQLAKAGGAIIVGFHVRPAGKAQQLAEQENVDVRLYEIIYEALDDVKKAMAGLLAPIKREKPIGKAEIRQVFSIPKIGTIGGCSILDGLIRRSSQVRLVRDSVQLYNGKISSLRRFKDDVREVEKGYECGIGIEGYNDIRVGDIIEAYEIEEIAPTL